METDVGSVEKFFVCLFLKQSQRLKKKFHFHFHRYEVIYWNVSVTSDHEYMYKLHPEKPLKLLIMNAYNLGDEKEIPVNSNIIYFTFFNTMY